MPIAKRPDEIALDAVVQASKTASAWKVVLATVRRGSDGLALPEPSALGDFDSKRFATFAAEDALAKGLLRRCRDLRLVFRPSGRGVVGWVRTVEGSAACRLMVSRGYFGVVRLWWVPSEGDAEWLPALPGGCLSESTAKDAAVSAFGGRPVRLGAAHLTDPLRNAARAELLRSLAQAVLAAPADSPAADLTGTGDVERFAVRLSLVETENAAGFDGRPTLITALRRLKDRPVIRWAVVASTRIQDEETFDLREVARAIAWAGPPSREAKK